MGVEKQRWEDQKQVQFPEEKEDGQTDSGACSHRDNVGTEPSKSRGPQKGLHGKTKVMFLSPVFESCAFSTTSKIIF